MLSFDRNSGQVYVETTSAEVKSMVPKWMSRHRGKKVNPLDFKNRRYGCNTLQLMALRSCVWHSDELTSDVLQCLDWHIAEKVYDELSRS